MDCNNVLQPEKKKDVLFDEVLDNKSLNKGNMLRVTMALHHLYIQFMAEWCK